MVKQKIKLSSRLAAFLLAVLMMASLFPAAAFADGPEDTPVPTDQPADQPAVVQQVETTPDGTNTQPTGSPAPEPAQQPTPEQPTPVYATQAELDAAFEAVGMADGLEAVTAAVEAYIAVYNRLSPDDQAANAEALAGAQSYLETLRQAAAAEESGEEFTDPDIELMYDSYDTKIVLSPSGATPTGTKMKVGDIYDSVWHVTSISTSKVTFEAAGQHNNDFQIPAPGDIWEGVTHSYNTVCSGSAFFNTPSVGAQGHIIYSGGNATYTNLKKVETPAPTPTPTRTPTPSGPYITVNHKYYTNGSLDASWSEDVSVSGTYAYAPDYYKATYNNVKYTDKSYDKYMIRLSGSGYQGTFNLTYNRTVKYYSYKLTWDYNDGKVGDDTSRTMTVSNVTVDTYLFNEDEAGYGNPKPERKGYKFTGWTYSGNGTFNEQIGKVEMTGAAGKTVSGTLTAQWERDTPVATQDLLTVKKTFIGLDDIPTDFSIVWQEVHGETGDTVTKTLTYLNAESIDEETMTLTWKVPHYHNTGGGSHTVTVTENCDVDGYTYTMGASGSWSSVGNKKVTRKINDNISGTTLILTNTYTPNKKITVTWLDENGTELKTVQIPEGSEAYKTMYPENPSTPGHWGTPQKDSNGNITIQWVKDTSAKPKLTGFTKTLVKTEQEAMAAGVPTTGITFPGSDPVKIGKDQTVTLLYKITVTGEVGASYTISDKMNGKTATRVQGEWSGTFTEGHTSADVYVTMSFTRDDINGEGNVVNQAKLEPGTGTDPTVPGGGEAVTSATKQFNVTINFVTDDTSAAQLHAPITFTVEENKSFTAELIDGTDPSVTDGPAVSIPRVFELNGKTYVLDGEAAFNALKAAGTKVTGDITQTLVYSLDEKTDPAAQNPLPGTNGDGIPDKYQVTVTYIAVGGTLDLDTETGKTRIETTVTLRKNGAWATSADGGEATLTNAQVPDSERLDASYKPDGVWKDANDADLTTQSKTPVGVTVKADTSFTVTYTQYTVTAKASDGTNPGSWPGGGSDDKTLHPDSDGNLTLPQINPPDGKELVGWFDENDRNVDPDKDGKITVTDDMTIHPVWKDKNTETVKVIFDPNGGNWNGATATTTVTTNKGTALDSKMPANPSRTGYTFSGWVIKDTTTPFTKDTSVTGDITVVAQWTADPTQTPNPSPSPSPNPTPNPNPNPTPNPGPVNPTPAPTAAPEPPAAEPAAVPVAPAPVVPAAPAAPVEEDLPEPATPEAGPAATPAPTETPAPVVENLDDEQAPLAGPAGGAWALVNLILMVLTILASILLLLGFAGKKQKELRDENGNRVLNADGEQQYEWSKKRHGGVRLFSLVPALGALIAFILTENIRLPMVLVDRWTLLMALIALVQVAVCLFAKKQKDEHDGETPSGPAPARA